MLARLDNLPPRHCSVTLHAAAPEVDFRNSLRAERISGRHDPCSRNSPCHARRGKPPAMACRLRKLRELQDPGGGRPALGCEIGKSLAEIAGIAGSWRRPSRAGLRDWQIACGNCGNYRILAAAVPRRAARLANRLRKLRELQDPGGGRPAPGREVGISLAEIAGTTRSRQWPSRAGFEIGKTLAETAETPAAVHGVHPLGETAKPRTAVSIDCLGLRGLRVKRGIGRGRRGARQSDDTRSA
jgi:hypothetical protein